MALPTAARACRSTPSRPSSLLVPRLSKSVCRFIALRASNCSALGYKIGDRFGPRTYPTANEAKLALFDDFWVATKDNERLWASD